MSSISSKKQTETRRIVVKTNSFVRFLEEFTAWQFAFKIIWPLGGFWFLKKNVYLETVLHEVGKNQKQLRGFYKGFCWFSKKIKTCGFLLKISVSRHIFTPIKNWISARSTLLEVLLYLFLVALSTSVSPRWRETAHLLKKKSLAGRVTGDNQRSPRVSNFALCALFFSRWNVHKGCPIFG